MKSTDRRAQRDRRPRLVTPPPPTERGLRFYQLLALAEEGSEAAAANLLREFGFRFGEDRP